MFTTREIEEIDAQLRAGVPPEALAYQRGLAYSTFRHRLLSAGKKFEKIGIMRRLVDAAPLPDERKAA